MGACGCGDFHAFAKFDGPPGLVYALGFYPGCDYCDTPAGLTVYRFSKKEAESWDVPHLPDVPWTEWDRESAEVAIPFLNVNMQTIGATFDEWWKKVRADRLDAQQGGGMMEPTTNELPVETELAVEPVAWRYYYKGNTGDWRYTSRKPLTGKHPEQYEVQPLYASPPEVGPQPVEVNMERVAQLTAHRCCLGVEHDPENGKLHGYCVVCGVPWPCDYAGQPSVASPPEVTQEMVTKGLEATKRWGFRVVSPLPDNSATAIFECGEHPRTFIEDVLRAALHGVDAAHRQKGEG